MLQKIKSFFSFRDRRNYHYVDLFVITICFTGLLILNHWIGLDNLLDRHFPSFGLSDAILHVLVTDMFAFAAVVAGYMYKKKRDMDKLNIVVITDDDIVTALINEEIDVLLQPIIRVSTNAIVGFESLVRLNHPIYGVLAPSEIFPIIKHADPTLAHRLTAYVINKTAEYYAEFAKSGHDFQMSVNLHPEDLHDATIISTVINSMMLHNMPSTRLTLEISEKTLLHDIASALKVLAGLDTINIKMALDDYGTKVTSFLHFRDFLVDEVKIDSILTHRIDFNRHNAEVVQAIVHTAHGMGACVTAKQVETKSSLIKVKEMGCDFAQGYVIAPPLTFEQAQLWIQTQNTDSK